LRNPFTLISARRRTPPGITSIERHEGGFVVWNLAYGLLEGPLLRAPARLARRIANEEVSGVALDLEGLDVPTADRTEAVARFVDELQLRGLSVVLHGVSATFLMAVQIEASHARFDTRNDLSDCVRILREYDEMRRRCTSDRGRRMNQLRMPARALSLAPLCRFLRDRLERGGLEAEAVLDLLGESYYALIEILETAYEPGEGDVSASVAVHDGRATVTILDSGKPRANEVFRPGEGGGVDRVHRFRILDRHNAVVLEKDFSERCPRLGSAAK
jgi:hypothetical protein